MTKKCFTLNLCTCFVFFVADSWRDHLVEFIFFFCFLSCSSFFFLLSSERNEKKQHIICFGVPRITVDFISARRVSRRCEAIEHRRKTKAETETTRLYHNLIMLQCVKTELLIPTSFFLWFSLSGCHYSNIFLWNLSNSKRLRINRF